MASLQTRLADAFTAVATDVKSILGKIGNTASLTTTATNLTGAINEVNAKPTGAINDSAASTTTSYSSSKTDSQIAAASTSDRARANHTGTQTASTISDFSSAADARITAKRGVANGVASLDSGGLVPAAQLPSYVDDVLEYASLANFPATGESGKIYTAIDTGRIYRWTGTVYTEISASPGSTDSVTEGTTNLYFTTARAAAAAPVQSVAGRTGAVTLAKGDVGLGNVDNTADTAKPVSTAQQTAINLRLLASNNLSDLVNAATARTNLSVYSQAEIGNPDTDLAALYAAAKA